MNKISLTFGKPRVLLPVVHVTDSRQALENVHVAKQAGADGAFLIAHDGIDAAQLIELARTIKMEFFPDFWIGCNFLDLQSPLAAHRQATQGQIDGLWTDNPQIGTEGAIAVQKQLSKQTLPLLYFGGFAFKYQEAVADLSISAKEALHYMDVVTTSGDATGSAPTIEKICAIREAIGDHPMAIASGVTIDNVHLFLPYCDAYLVATGISSDWRNLDPKMTAELAIAIHSHR